jgi:YggT family protein
MVPFVLRQFTMALATILDGLLSLYFWIVLIAALLSWVSPDPRNPIVRFLYSVTEPVLYQIRRRLPFVHAAGIDFSPLVLMVAIQFTKMVLVASLYELAQRIGTLASEFLRVA